MREIEPIDSFYITGRGRAYNVKEPDPLFVLGEHVIHEGELRCITGIERHCIEPKPGRTVGLLLGPPQ